MFRPGHLHVCMMFYFFIPEGICFAVYVAFSCAWLYFARFHVCFSVVFFVVVNFLILVCVCLLAYGHCLQFCFCNWSPGATLHGLTHCLVRGGERDWVHLGRRPLVRPLYQAPSIQLNDTWQGKQKYHRSLRLSITSATKSHNPIYHTLTADISEQTTNRMSYVMSWCSMNNNLHNHEEKVMNMLQRMRSLMCVLVFNSSNTQIGVRISVVAYRYALSAFSFLVFCGHESVPRQSSYSKCL
jgi:hypothetical protein